MRPHGVRRHKSAARWGTNRARNYRARRSPSAVIMSKAHDIHRGE